ncbi:MAG: hypothetical protein WCP39_07325 [Chlamydiota bacterium]
MKNLLYKIFVFFALAFSILLLGKGWQLATDGFRIDKIYTRLSPKPNAFTPPKGLYNILNQKFYYLDKGCQTFVFESSDHQYVLKLIRYHKYRPPFSMHYLNLCESGKKYRKKREAFRARSQKNALHSYLLSFEKLSTETQTVYVHLQKSSFFKAPLTIVDRLGRSYSLDLDEVGFLIQRKGHSLVGSLQEAQKENNIDKTKVIVHSFFETITSMYKKGIVNKDYNCIKNAGVIDSKVVEIDLGSFYEQDLQNPKAFAKELHIFIKHFRKWGEKHYPEILPILELEYTLATQ